MSKRTLGVNYNRFQSYEQSRLHSMSRDGMSKDAAYARNTENGYDEESGPRL